MPLPQRPPHHEQADRADRSSDRETEDETANAERGIHWSSSMTMKTALGTCAGALLVGWPGADGRVGSDRGGPGEPSLRETGDPMGRVHFAQGARSHRPMSTAAVAATLRR